MSSTETPKRKPGRPRKKKPSDKDILTKKPMAESVVKESPEAAQVREILKEAEAESSKLLQSEPDVSGKSPDTNPSTDPGQADFIPGTRLPDLLSVPEKVYDERTGIERLASLPKEYHYCWVESSKITQFRVWGYRMCLYNGGSLSGLADKGFSGTNLYERTLDNKVRHGDVFLMYVPMRAYENLKAEERKKLEDWNNVPKTEMHNVAYGAGVRTFEEVDGMIVNN